MKLTGLLFILCFTLSAKAEELLESNISARAMGMGNAYVSVVSDKDALFYNPAALQKIRGIHLTIMDPYLGADGQDVYDTYQALSDSTSTSNAFATQLRQLYGKKIWIGGGGKTAISLPGFAAAGYGAFSGSAYLSNPAFPNLNVKFFTDYGFATGVGMQMAPGWSVGLVGKRISRIGAAFPIGVSTLALLSSDSLQNELNNRGTGYALDFGTSLTIPSPVSPTLSLVWKNMGWTTFTQDFGSYAPPMIKDEMIFGFSFLIDGPGVDIRHSMDLKYFNRYDEQLGKKLHFGIEVDMTVLSLRAGLNQGYYTVGAGIDLAFVRVDAATYGVELGEYPGQHEDRRYMLQATMELGFDPSGLGSSLSSKGSAASRGVKARR
jgi:hypothetical protein